MKFLQDSSSRGWIAICQVSNVEIRVTRLESRDLPFIVPIPEGRGPEAQAWYLANNARDTECTKAAVTVLNRLLDFFKYGLINPLLEHFSLHDLLDHKWLDENGEVIETGLSWITGTWSFTPLKNTLHPGRDAQLQYCLENELAPSLVEEILLDAMGALAEKNLRTAVIEAAVCAEVATRESFKFEYLDEKEEHIATVADLLSRIARGVSGVGFDDFDQKSFDNIKLLFQIRNKGAHEGKPYYKDSEGTIHTVTKAQATEWLESIEVLLAWLVSSSGDS